MLKFLRSIAISVVLCLASAPLLAEEIGALDALRMLAQGISITIDRTGKNGSTLKPLNLTIPFGAIAESGLI